MNPKRSVDFVPENRLHGRDWPEVAHSMIGLKRLENLRELCSRAINEGIRGDFVETGVWRGGACILMRGVLAAYQDTDRRVFCCDSFEGLPPPDPINYRDSPQDKHHTYDELRVSLEEVQENFARYGLLDNQVVFVKGFFRDTLHALDSAKIAVLRLDGDMYESTIQALEALYHRVSEGGFVIIDDYGCIPACKQAVEDFLVKRNISPQIHKIDWTGVWWQKGSEQNHL